MSTRDSHPTHPHQWEMYKGTRDIDTFAYDVGEHQGRYCNGPRCEACGYQFCHHCNQDGYGTPCPKWQGLPV